MKYYEKYFEPGFGYATVLLSDSTGASATVTWDWTYGRLDITRSSGSYLCAGANEFIINNKLAEDSSDISVDRFSNLLYLSRQPYLTVYSTIYDLTNKKIHLFYNRDYSKSIQWNLFDELDKPASLYRMRDLFPREASRTTGTVEIFKEVNFVGLIIILSALVFYISIFGYWVFKVFGTKIIFADPGRGIETTLMSMSLYIEILNSILFIISAALLFFYPSFIIEYGFGLINSLFGFIPILVIGFTSVLIILNIFILVKNNIRFHEKISFTFSNFIFAISIVVYLFFKWSFCK